MPLLEQQYKGTGVPSYELSMQGYRVCMDKYMGVASTLAARQTNKKETGNYERRRNWDAAESATVAA